jgi:alanyl-tRNA synthetase
VVFKLPAEQLIPSVDEEDDEAFGSWREQIEILVDQSRAKEIKFY